MLSELSSSQRDLAEYMSSLSEAAYHASWVEGLEFSLWRAVVQGPFRYGQLQLTSEHVRRLAQLSERCGGWIVFHQEQEESFVSLDDWKRSLERA